MRSVVVPASFGHVHDAASVGAHVRLTRAVPVREPLAILLVAARERVPGGRRNRSLKQ